VDANDLEETHMNVTREIILDLLPVYLSGEASPATRSLVEEYMKRDPELAQRIRLRPGLRASPEARGAGSAVARLYGAPQVGLARQAPELPLQCRSPEMPQGQHCSALVAVRQYIPMM